MGVKRVDLVALSIFKLIAFPFIGIILIYPLYSRGYIGDPVLAFILLMQFAAPVDPQLIIICNLRQAFVFCKIY